MRTTGVVMWFDRSTGMGQVLLNDGGGCVAVQSATLPAAPPTASASVDVASGARGRSGGRLRDPRVDEAAAFRAGTWGDGGRDY